MKRPIAIFLLILTLSALACGMSPDSPASTALPTSVPTQNTAATRQPTSTSTATSMASPTPPTALSTQESTPNPPRPSPTPGLPPATLPPGVTPTAHIPAVIHLFHVSPFQALEPGDAVTVVWEYEGNDGMICQVVPETGPTDCVDVPRVGEREFTVLDTGKPYWLVLYVNVATFPDAELIETANLYLGCEHTWFFDQPEVAVCPQSAPHTGPIAAQPFERGVMLWVEDVGVYLGLVDVQAGGGDLLRAVDPLNILRDTADQVSAPPGLVAPTSGFGLVWRGDAEVYPDWRAALGWGLEPEFSYQGTYQCDNSVATRWRFCYVTHYDGWLAVLHPNGYWYPKSVTFLED
jgi:hypothetical protein